MKTLFSALGPELGLMVMPFQEIKVKAETTSIKQFLSCSKNDLLAGCLAKIGLTNRDEQKRALPLGRSIHVL